MSSPDPADLPSFDGYSIHWLVPYSDSLEQEAQPGTAD